MKTFKQLMTERCWPGYKSVPGKKPYSLGSCRKEEVEMNESTEFTPKFSFRQKVQPHIDKHLDDDKVAGAHTSITYHKQPTGDVHAHVSYRNISGKTVSGVGPTQRKKFLVNKDHTITRIKEEVETLDEKGPGLWANIRAKKARGERMRKPGEEGAPTEAQLKSARNEEYEADDGALTEDQLEQLREAAAWERAEGKNPEGGLNRKGIESYRRENPGSKLSMAVTTKPSKLDPDSKAAKRRKSFCARMGGMKKRLTSAETAKDPDSRINKALRKWNC
jgi:hypothetical protein